MKRFHLSVILTVYFDTYMVEDMKLICNFLEYLTGVRPLTTELPKFITAAHGELENQHYWLKELEAPDKQAPSKQYYLDYLERQYKIKGEWIRIKQQPGQYDGYMIHDTYVRIDDGGHYGSRITVNNQTTPATANLPKMVIPPKGGWKTGRYYLVALSYGPNNPFHYGIMYYGFHGDNIDPDSTEPYVYPERVKGRYRDGGYFGNYALVFSNSADERNSHAQSVYFVAGIQEVPCPSNLNLQVSYESHTNHKDHIPNEGQHR